MLQGKIIKWLLLVLPSIKMLDNIVYAVAICELRGGRNMYNYLMLLTAMTGDNGRPLLIAICLIVSIVLTVVLIITGKTINKRDNDEDNDDSEE